LSGHVGCYEQVLTAARSAMPVLLCPIWFGMDLALRYLPSAETLYSLSGLSVTVFMTANYTDLRSL